MLVLESCSWFLVNAPCYFDHATIPSPPSPPTSRATTLLDLRTYDAEEKKNEEKQGDEQCWPDLPIGSDKSVGGELDVDDPKASTRTDRLPCNHYTTAPMVINRVARLTSPRMLNPCKRTENTSKNIKDAI